MRLIYLKTELDDLTQGSRISYVRQFRLKTQDEVSDMLDLTGENEESNIVLKIKL